MESGMVTKTIQPWIALVLLSLFGGTGLGEPLTETEWRRILGSPRSSDIGAIEDPADLQWLRKIGRKKWSEPGGWAKSVSDTAKCGGSGDNRTSITLKLAIITRCRRIVRRNGRWNPNGKIRMTLI